MISWMALAKGIENALTPMGPFIPQPFPWGQVLLAVGICAAVFFFFLIFLPRLASNTLLFGKIATLFIAVSLALLLPFSIHALRSPTKTLTKARSGTVPNNVAVTGVTADSFTVEWETQAEAIGMIKYGPGADDLKFFALDEKGNIATTIHRIKVENLKSKTRYYFEVVSGQFRFNDDGQPLEVETL